MSKTGTAGMVRDIVDILDSCRCRKCTTADKTAEENLVPVMKVKGRNSSLKLRLAISVASPPKSEQGGTGNIEVLEEELSL